MKINNNKLLETGHMTVMNIQTL